MARTILAMALFYLILARVSCEKSKGFLSAVEQNLENKLTKYVSNISKWLEGFNDKYLGQSDLGRLLHYEEIKSKLEETGRRRSMKKMGMGMLPLIFHVGATSTWMVLTTILAAKSVAIGLILLVFKIAVSSAKVASFFTALKSKHEPHGWAWSPHFEHHGHGRSLSGIAHHMDIPELQSHAQDWSNNLSQDYKTIGSYKDYSEHSHNGPFQALAYVEDAHSHPH